MAVLVNFCVICICLLCELNLCHFNEDETQVVVDTYSSLPSLPTQHSLLPDCNKQNTVSKSLQNELLIISTLDGTLSALDVEEDIRLQWSKRISSEPLLSSTISNFELTKKGQIVRIVPSLDGNLYLYNGKTIDGIPLNAETLLKSSYKLGDDLVITGGQESNILGINILTGHVYYECGVRGCPESQLNENETFDDLFLLKRITQTVRAIEPRTGQEKWYFSVSEPQLSTTPPSQCHNNYDSNHFYDESERNEYKITDNPSQPIKETEFKVIVPNGIISGKRSIKNGDKSETTDWQYKFESPIVHIWHYKNGILSPLNLFDKQRLFGFANLGFDTHMLEPSIYIGRFQNQWYVQSSDKIKDHISSQKKIQNDLLATETTNSGSKSVLQIEWKPQELIYNKENDLNAENGFELVSRPQFSLSSNSLNDNTLGYYIIDVIEDNETKCYSNQSEQQLDMDSDYGECDEEDGIMQQIVIASLWHYWREVSAISIFSAFVLNYFFSYIKRKLRLKCNVINDCEENEKNISPTIATEVMPFQEGSPSTPSFSSPFNQLNYGDNNSFTSRYLEDFQPIQVLGKGGFGLVFESKHLIDESHYAVKRICLPCRKEQRDKVMREVKALSKLDHSGIVRYYNAWVELPPPGWQESKDKEWANFDISEAHYNDLYKRSKQVVNTSLVSDFKNSISFKTKHNLTETIFSFNSKHISFNETQCSQSLDIVFDENVSSIKVLETNAIINSLLDSGFANKNANSKSNECELDTNVSELNTNVSEFKDNKSLIEQKCRPTSFNPLPLCYLYIQMQLCRKDTLKDWLFNNACNRDQNEVLNIFEQIVNAVHYVHSMGLMHRDLKPSNIFFSIDGSIKIGDFGLVTATAIDEESHTPATNGDYFEDSYSTILSQDSNTHTNRVGTQLYMSPEQIRNAPYSHKVDIFSMGIILFELLVPFKTEMERNVLLKSARKQVFPVEFSENFKTECNLLKQLLSHNPEDRPSTSEIREHELMISFESKTETFTRERRRTLSQTNPDIKC